MKTRLLLSIAVAVMLASCSTDEDILLMSKNVSESVQTRSVSNAPPWFDWERVNTINITGRGIADLPWSAGATAAIPEHILENYTRKEGWVMVYNNIGRIQLQGLGQRNHYLIFYNKFTGVLRSFYYHIPTVGVGTTTLWRIGFSVPTALLNSSTYFTQPMNVRERSYLFTPNMTIVKGLSRGWNVFDIELSFDEALSGRVVTMNIAAQNLLSGEIIVDGTRNFTSTETVVTSTTSPNNVNHFVNAGNSAAGGIGSAVGGFISTDRRGVFRNLSVTALSALSGGATTELLRAGVNLAFGSFTSRRDPTITTTERNTRFTSSEVISVSGTIQMGNAAEVHPIANLHVPGTLGASTSTFVPSYNVPLGVWNIRSAPVVRMSDAITWAATDMYPGLGHGALPGHFISTATPSRTVYLLRSSVDVVVNPAVIPYIYRYEVAMELVNYTRFQGRCNWRGGIDGVRPTNHPWSITGTVLFSSDDTEIIRHPYQVWQNVKHMEFRACNDPAELCFPFLLTRSNNIFNTDFVVKVTVTLFPRASRNGQQFNTDPVVMTRSFLPRYEIFEEYRYIRHFFQ